MKSQFEKKYGAEFIRAAENNEGGCVNPKVVDRLHCMPPSPFVVTVGGVYVPGLWITRARNILVVPRARALDAVVRS